ncbi:hypothetical protein GCM10010299_14320 [Streptomyces tanashiensis]|nr:hypothetical protein GCM10010299_14320 [Streptomyces tanashiensis]
MTDDAAGCKETVRVTPQTVRGTSTSVRSNEVGDYIQQPPLTAEDVSGSTLLDEGRSAPCLPSACAEPGTAPCRSPPILGTGRAPRSRSSVRRTRNSRCVLPVQPSPAVPGGGSFMKVLTP